MTAWPAGHSHLRIVADDLTGALDTAAPFASPHAPVTIALPGRPCPDRALLAASTESRDLSVHDATARVALICRALAGDLAPDSVFWLKKVDSVLRGHPFAETAQMMETLGLRRCVFAPAFPEMGRITRNGHQFMQGPGGWTPTPASDIAAGFGSLEQHRAQASDPFDIAIIDAEDQQHLSAAVEKQSGDTGVLWAGARGLAEALAGRGVALGKPDFGVVIVGTTHPATRAQIAACGDRVTHPPAWGPIGRSNGQTVLIDPVPQSPDAFATRHALRDTLRRLDADELRGRGILVVGGDSLTIALELMEGLHLECRGEIGAGLPSATICGGPFEGCTLVSKSGGFGPPHLLRDLLAR